MVLVYFLRAACIAGSQSTLHTRNSHMHASKQPAALLTVSPLVQILLQKGRQQWMLSSWRCRQRR